MGRHRFVDDVAGDADHTDRKFTNGEDFVRIKRQIAACFFVGIDCQNRVIQLLADLFQIFRTKTGVPVERHGIEADFVQHRQHMPTFRSDRFISTVDRVAVIENECRIFAAEIFDQALDAGIAACFAERQSFLFVEQFVVQLQVAVGVVDLKDRQFFLHRDPPFRMKCDSRVHYIAASILAFCPPNPDRYALLPGL
ncbi:hypothetical protein SDC9_122359 [bioreactor metagenome]|uniref:Uncharacterized protein n=1 Tax=bioreactor metagenome TaxID=1076179 RepID=A0A645CEI3_9ZZZZ